MSLAAALLTASRFSYSQVKQAGESAQTQQGGGAVQRSGEAPPIVVKVVPPNESKEATREEQQYRDDQSRQERRIALATVWLAVVTTALAIFTALLWYATVKLVKGAEDIARRQSRAFLFGKGFSSGPNIVDERVKEYVVFSEIENVGMTSATDVRIWVQWKQFPMNEDLSPMFERDASGQSAVMGPRAVGRTGYITIPIESLIQNWTHKTEILVWSRVEYRDVFDPKVLHHHEQCARIETIHDPTDLPPMGHPPYLSFAVYGPQNTIS